uniref:rRNA methyltransferase 1, mitochondrial n=1 Tax=Rhodosorus marinus TaxID=101924 RepID=A0A7S3ED50_9RHOD
MFAEDMGMGFVVGGGLCGLPLRISATNKVRCLASGGWGMRASGSGRQDKPDRGAGRGRSEDGSSRGSWNRSDRRGPRGSGSSGDGGRSWERSGDSGRLGAGWNRSEKRSGRPEFGRSGDSRRGGELDEWKSERGRSSGRSGDSRRGGEFNQWKAEKRRSGGGRNRAEDGNRSPRFDGARSGDATRGNQDDEWYAPRAFDERRERTDEEELSELQLALRSGNDFVFGANPVLAALQCKRRNLMYALWVADSATTRDRIEAKQILELASKLHIEVKNRSKGDLNAMSGNRPHQGFVLESSPLEMVPITQLDKTEEGFPLWLALDEVTDPMNFGALTRSALFLRTAGIVVSEKNCCSLTPTASKASSGALEVLPIHSAKNLPAFLNKCSENGWRILGAHLHPDSKDVKQFQLDQPTVLVVGSEGTGLRTNVLNCCDEYVQIGGGSVGTVDSLNVSVASGILLHHFLG